MGKNDQFWEYMCAGLFTIWEWECTLFSLGRGLLPPLSYLCPGIELLLRSIRDPGQFPGLQTDFQSGEELFGKKASRIVLSGSECIGTPKVRIREWLKGVSYWPNSEIYTNLTHRTLVSSRRVTHIRRLCVVVDVNPIWFLLSLGYVVKPNFLSRPLSRFWNGFRITTAPGFSWGHFEISQITVSWGASKNTAANWS